MSTVNHETGEIVETLTQLEKRQLTHAEVTIKNGLESFVEVGEALAQVRNARLYRAGFRTFEAYCQGRWGLSRSLAYDTIAAAETVSEMSAFADTPVPVNVGQARELAGLTPDMAAQVMREAAPTINGKPTAATIREARDRVAPRVDHAARADAAIAEFPDLAYYRDEAPDLEHCWRLAEKLREYRARGELDERIDTLRRSIALARAKRDGTYEQGSAAVMNEAGEYEMQPMTEAASILSTCPTCGQKVSS